MRVEQLIAEIYHWFDGYDCSEMEQIELDNGVEEKSWLGRLVGGHEASVYGEVLPEGIQNLLDYIDDDMPLSKEDVFVDLGSGTGKIVLQVALATDFKKVIGIELSETRHGHAIKAVEEARKLSISVQEETKREEHLGADIPDCKEFANKVTRDVASGRVQIIHGDIMEPTYNDATHLYAASTTWPDVLLHTVTKIGVEKIKGLKSFSTLRPIPPATLKEFRSVYLWKTVELAVSWQDTAPMHIYKFGK